MTLVTESVDPATRVLFDSAKRVKVDSYKRVEHSHFGDKQLTLFLESVDPVNVLCAYNSNKTQM